MNKWDYIGAISHTANRYGDKLVEPMETCGALNLQEVPETAAREYYETMKGADHHEPTRQSIQ